MKFTMDLLVCLHVWVCVCVCVCVTVLVDGLSKVKFRASVNLKFVLAEQAK